ncbi:MAG TPA: hypothetical protein VG452_08435, partial [Egibacteraceae bacterium]|nr:hypothetical protein [Egibacteraceae bacterium]
GRPDVRRPVHIRRDALARVAATTGCRLRRGGQLPLGLAVLALLAPPRPLVPLAVAAACGFNALATLGEGIARALAGRHLRAAVVAAGDLSAGLSEASPLHRIEGAAAWDDDVVAAVRHGALSTLARLGPAEAARMGALGWAPLAVLQGVCARAGTAPVVHHYSAPRGVGYLVADSAGGDLVAESAGEDLAAG